MKLVYTIYKDLSINIFHQGEIFNIEASDRRFNIIEELLLNDQHSEVVNLLDPKIIFQNQKNLSFQNDRVFFKGEMLPIGIANAIFEGILNQDNINNYLYTWEKCSKKIKENKTQFWNVQANKLFYNIYPFEEFLLCLMQQDPSNPLNIDCLIFLNKTNSQKFPHIINMFMKKMSLSRIMKELNLSGDKLKKTIKQKMITEKLLYQFSIINTSHLFDLQPKLSI
jgi:hypothetical protein